MALIIQTIVALLCVTSATADNWLQYDDSRRPPPRKQQAPPPRPPAMAQKHQAFHEKPLDWKFPEPPTEEAPNYPDNFVLKMPPAVESVRAECGEQAVRVEALRDLLGIGHPVEPSDVTLGGCGATMEDPDRGLLIFDAELHTCGSQLTMTEDEFIYLFTLSYSPSQVGSSPIVRTSAVEVHIQCRYKRKHEVSGGNTAPIWDPFTASKVSEESLYFSFMLMTEDWKFSRPSHQYYFGDMMKFEVAVKQFYHGPLRVTVDSCVATIVPNVDTVPRYRFLGNNGCMFDSQLTGSSSRFLPRSANDRLQFELEAFRFQLDPSGVIYITCNVRATLCSTPIDATNKACSFANGWTEATGDHHVCACCDSICGSGGVSHTTTATGPQWEEEMMVGPIPVLERPIKN